ncbi:MAG: hypothetical protein ABSA17_05345 [Rhabdochlamydiaceae bacterium]|jgi:hypothetical protein
MSAVIEKSLSMLNWGIEQLPTSMSNIIGNLPRVYSERGLNEVPMSYFTKWFDLKDHFYPSIPTITTLRDWSDKMKNGQLGYIDTNTDTAHLYGPAIVMPEMSLLKKIFLSAAITLATSAIVSAVSYTATKLAATYFCNKENDTDAVKGARKETIEKTVKISSGFLGLCTALAVGRAAYELFYQNPRPGIYGNNGWHFIHP